MSREREIVFNVTVDGNVDTLDGSGFLVVDLSQWFKFVYKADISGNSFLNGHISYLAGTENDASLGVLTFIGTDGTNVTLSETAQTFFLTVRGI